MNKLFLLVLLIISTRGFTQTNPKKKVIVTKFGHEVPHGKKWVVESGNIIRIQVNQGVFNSGSACNAAFLSNPGIIFSIEKGNIFKSAGYGIIFKDYKKVPYTNNYTFDITPISFGNQYSLSQIKNKSPDMVGMKKLEFIQGDNVFVANCLESIELSEVDMTTQDFVIYNDNQKELRRQKTIDSLQGLVTVKNSSNSSESVDTNKIYTFVDRMPEFPGGTEALHQYLLKNVKYPDDAKEKKIIGTVILQFVVKSNGSICDIKVIRGLDGGCTEEAIRVVENMPKWSPGINYNNGLPVSVYFNIPISFILSQD